jgi:large subunit ribosomal protein L14
MIQVGTNLKIIDNSGGREAYCIGVLSGYKQRYAVIGDIITVAIKKLRTRRRITSKVKKGDVLKALIIRTKSPLLSKIGTISFFENSVILLNNQKKILGTRIFGAVPKQFRYTKHLRLTFLAAGLIN